MKSYRAGVASTPLKYQKILLNDNMDRKTWKYTNAFLLPWNFKFRQKPEHNWRYWSKIPKYHFDLQSKYGTNITYPRDSTLPLHLVALATFTDPRRKSPSYLNLETSMVHKSGTALKKNS
jgi:hypothetical protein